MSPIRQPKFVVKKNHDGQWSLRIVAVNGRILAHSEGYSAKRKALDACRIINPALPVRVIE